MVDKISGCGAMDIRQSIGSETQQSSGMKVYGLRLLGQGSELDDEREEVGGVGLAIADEYSCRIELGSVERWFFCGRCGGDIRGCKLLVLSWVASFGAFFGRCGAIGAGVERGSVG